MAIKVVRSNGEEVTIKDGAMATEEFDKIIIFTDMGTAVARFKSDQVAEWWVVESEEQDSEAGT